MFVHCFDYIAKLLFPLNLPIGHCDDSCLGNWCEDQKNRSKFPFWLLLSEITITLIIGIINNEETMEIIDIIIDRMIVHFPWQHFCVYAAQHSWREETKNCTACLEHLSKVFDEKRQWAMMYQFKVRLIHLFYGLNLWWNAFFKIKTLSFITNPPNST